MAPGFDHCLSCFIQFLSVIVVVVLGADDGISVTQATTNSSIDPTATCLSSGAMAGLVFGCVLGTVVIVFVLALVTWWIYKSRRKNSGDILVIEKPSSPTRGYENAGFRDENGTKITTTQKRPQQHRPLEKAAKKVSTVSIFEKLRPKKSLAKVDSHRRTGSMESLGSMQESVKVQLRSRDLNGLGFTIHGNMRDGIFVKEVNGRGPAAESGLVHVGDRIMNVRIDFEKMVFEDALTILSYASPYPVTLELKRPAEENRIRPDATTPVYKADRQARIHPLYRSQSVAYLPEFPDANQQQSSANGVNDNKLKREAFRSQSVNTDLKSPKQQQTPAITAVDQPKYKMERLERLESIQESPREARASSTTNVDVGRAPEADQKVQMIKEDPYASLSIADKIDLMRLSYEETSFTQSTPNIFAAVDEPKLNSGGVSNQRLERKIDTASSVDSIPDLEEAKATLERRKKSSLALAVDDAKSPPQFAAMTAVFHQSNPGPVLRIPPPLLDRHLNNDTPSANGEDAAKLYRDKKLKLKSTIDRANWMPHPSHHHQQSNGDFIIDSAPVTPTTTADRWPLPKHIDFSNKQRSFDMGVSNEDAAGAEPPSKLFRELDVEQRKKMLYFQQQLSKQQEELAEMGIHVPVSRRILANNAANGPRGVEQQRLVANGELAT